MHDPGLGPVGWNGQAGAKKSHPWQVRQICLLPLQYQAGHLQNTGTLLMINKTISQQIQWSTLGGIGRGVQLHGYTGRCRFLPNA